MKVTLKRMRNAIERARKLAPAVRVVDAQTGLFEVDSPNGEPHSYRVQLRTVVNAEGRRERHATCFLLKSDGTPERLCHANKFQNGCFHVAATLGLNLRVQALMAKAREFGLEVINPEVVVLDPVLNAVEQDTARAAA
jgi:hypothetical protein